MNVEKSEVTRPWRIKLLGFTFNHKKGSKGISLHRKSIATYKDKIRAITCRSKPQAMEDRMMQIRQLNQGWGNYFKLSEAKSVLLNWMNGCEVGGDYATGSSGGNRGQEYVSWRNLG